MEHEQSGLVEHKFKTGDDGQYLMKREARKTNDSTFDRVYKYYHSAKTRVELTDEEKHLAERWEKAWLLRCRYRTKKQVADILCRLFNIEKSVAYDDVNKASMLFTDPVADSRDAKRAIAETAFLQGAHKAWVTGELELHLKYMKEYSDINGLKAEGDGNIAELLKKLKPHQIIIVSSQAELEAQANAIQEEVIRDIGHEELDGED
jgi:hypothetical protein